MNRHLKVPQKGSLSNHHEKEYKLFRSLTQAVYENRWIAWMVMVQILSSPENESLQKMKTTLLPWPVTPLWLWNIVSQSAFLPIRLVDFPFRRVTNEWLNALTIHVDVWNHSRGHSRAYDIDIQHYLIESPQRPLIPLFHIEWLLK